MAVLIRSLPALVFALALAVSACGGATEGPSAAPEAEKTESGMAEIATAIDPKLAAQIAKDKQDADKLAAQKPAFDKAIAYNDPLQIDELAVAGNAWALFHRAEKRIASHDYMMQQGGIEDMEAAADHGFPSALMWVGERKAYGKDGYKLQPNSGLMMMERAARHGNVAAMVAVGTMYELDAYMHDKKRGWYERASEAGSAQAEDALTRMDGGAPGEAPAVTTSPADQSPQACF